MATYSTVFYSSGVDGSASTPVTWLDALFGCVSSYQGNLLFSYIVKLLDRGLGQASVKLKAKRYTEKSTERPRIASPFLVNTAAKNQKKLLNSFTVFIDSLLSP